MAFPKEPAPAKPGVKTGLMGIEANTKLDETGQVVPAQSYIRYSNVDVDGETTWTNVVPAGPVLTTTEKNQLNAMLTRLRNLNNAEGFNA